MDCYARAFERALSQIGRLAVFFSSHEPMKLLSTTDYASPWWAWHRWWNKSFIGSCDEKKTGEPADL